MFNRHLLASAIAAVAMSSALVIAPASAQSPTEHNRRSWDIPPGSLEEALATLAAVAGAPLSFDPALVAGKRSSGLRGDYSLQEGFDRLLTGSGLESVRKPDGSYTLRPAPLGAMTLGPVRVQAAVSDGTTEGTGSYTSNYVSFGKGQSVRELPQSITVMTRQRIEDQALNSIEDVLRQTTGVTVANSSTGLNGEASVIYSRGFKVSSMQVDGANIDEFGSYFAPNLAMYDSVQVLRGADGLFGGTGSPGGSINLVRKRPTAESQVKVTFSAGSWNNYNAELDVAGPLALDGKLRGRAVLAHQDREYFFDIADSRTTLLYAIAEWDVTASTKLSIGGSYERNRETPWRFGLPRATNGADLGLSRSTVLATPWSERERDNYQAFVQLDQQLGDNWSLRIQANYMDSDSEAQYGFLSAAIDPATGDGLRLNVSSPFWYSTKKTLDANLKGNFELFGLQHKLLVGADWQDIRWTEDLYFAGGATTPANLYTLNLHAIPKPTAWYISRSYPDYGAEQDGFYARLNASLTDRFTLVIGARYSNYDYESPYFAYDASGAVTAHSVSRYDESGIFTPYAGIVYEVNDAWTAYASVTEIYQSQASRLGGPLPGSPLDAIEGRNYEIGVKSDLAGDKLTAAAAIYRIERTGEAVRDPAYASTNIGDEGLNCCWLEQGEVLSEGVDLELTGELAQGWQLFAGYTYNRNENEQTNVVYSAITPKHLFKLWSTYQLPAQWSDWTLGAGVTAQSASYVSGTARAYNPATDRYDGATVPFDFTQAGYALWSASVQYHLQPGWSLALNASNLFDKVYYKQLGNTSSGNWYGEPRNFTMTLRGQF